MIHLSLGEFAAVLAAIGLGLLIGFALYNAAADHPFARTLEHGYFVVSTLVVVWLIFFIRTP